MLRNNFITAWRNLFRNKSFSIINILGLSIGITCSLVISIFIRYELGFDHYHQKADHIYKVVQETRFAEETQYWNTTAYPLAEAMRNDFAGLPFVTQASGPVPRLFRVEDKAGNVSRFEEQYVLFVDPYYLKVFDFQWIEGNPTTALLKPSSVILTKSLVKKYFNAENSSVLGKHLMLNNKDELTVTGVVEDAPANTSLKYSMLIPYEFFRVNNPYFAGNWSGNYQGSTFIVLNEGQSVTELEKQFATWKKKYLKPEDDNRITYRLQSLKTIHTDEKFGSSPQSYVMPQKMIYGAMGVAIFILVIACVNFINLATAQAANRAKEVGIRKIMGSSKVGLVTQFLNENTLLVGFTLIISIAFTQFALNAINQTLSILNLHLVLDWSAVTIVSLIGCLVIVLACIYPAIVMASYRPIESLKNKFISQGKGKLSLRRSLIVFQFAIVQLFIIGTLVVAFQMDYFKNKDLGFSNEEPIIITNLNGLDKNEVFKQRLLTNPSIKEVCFSSSSPVSDYNQHYGTSFRLASQSETEGKEAEMKGIDTNFISFYGLALLAGRNFTTVEENFKEFIVNEKVIKALGWTPEEAIGRQLTINEGTATIIGVVKDFHNNSLQDEITPCILINWSYFLERAHIKIQSQKNSASVLPLVENTWKELYTEGIYNFAFLNDALAKNYAIEQLVYTGFAAFAALAILIGCLGLYGLISFVTLRRTKEVGIRKVLGASVVNILQLFSKEFVILVSVAFIIAAPLAYYFMDQWLNGFVYHIRLAWWMFALGAILTIVIALVTISFQTVKAAVSNPVESLRSE